MASRQLIVLRGTPEETADAAKRLAGDLDALWLDAQRPPKLALGGTWDVVILDGHEKPSADALSAAAGAVAEGGAMILRLAADTPSRFWARLRSATPGPIMPERRAFHGLTGPQQRVLSELEALPDHGIALLIADRGRGKSTALGHLRKLGLVLTGPRAAATAEAKRWSGLPFTPLDRVPKDAPWVLVDEAAQIALPNLRAFVATHPGRLIFASTVHGYEGTGRGFLHRFRAELQAGARPLTECSLTEPIRWSSPDPLEQSLRKALLTDANASGVANVFEHQRLTPDLLSERPSLLRSAWGLLRDAHYRTTPSDLQRLLDDPSLHLHALVDGDRVAAVNLVAVEGPLAEQDVEAIARGTHRVRGHALPETLIAHMGIRPVGLRFVRSVRLAVHAESRRQGLAKQLVGTVHRQYKPDLFGTLFGATASVIGLRRALGYELARLGIAGGPRSGEPPAMMLRAQTPGGRELMELARRRFAAGLPYTERVLRRDVSVAIPEALWLASRRDLPSPDVSDRVDALRHYLHAGRTFDSVAHHLQDVTLPQEREQAVLTARRDDAESWQEAAKRGGFDTVRAAHRALKVALRTTLIEISEWH